MSGGSDSASAGTSNEELVVRPRKTLRSSQGGSVSAAVGWIVVSVLYSLRFHGWGRVSIVAAGVCLAAGAIGLINLAHRRMKLTVVDGRLVFKGLLRDRVALARGSTGRVVDVEVAWGKASHRRSRLWLLINEAGQTEVGLNRETWDRAQLEGLRERLGLPIEIVDAPQRPAEVRKAYPGTLPWWVAHPSMAALLAIVTLTAVVLAVQGLAS